MKNIKTVILFTLLIISVKVSSQPSKNLTTLPQGPLQQPPLQKNQAADTCQSRGHVLSAAGSIQAATCPDRFTDYGDSTVLVRGGCNSVIVNCLRCKKQFLEPEKSINILIWKKEDKLKKPAKKK